MAKTYHRKDLLEHCNAESIRQVSVVNALFSASHSEDLLTSPYPGKWSAKQCVEHLIATLNLYLPRIEKALEQAKTTSKEDYKHGLIGYRFFNDILPQPGEKMTKMKTFKSLDPKVTGVSSEDVVRDFAEKMKRLNHLLHISKEKNLQKIRITSAAGPLLRLRLGDVFLFLLNHNTRHIIQAEKAIKTNVKRKGLS